MCYYKLYRYICCSLARLNGCVYVLWQRWAWLESSSRAGTSQHRSEAGAISSVLWHERSPSAARSARRVLSEQHPLSPAHRRSQNTDVLWNDGGHFCQALMRSLRCGNSCAVAIMPLFMKSPWYSFVCIISILSKSEKRLEPCKLCKLSHGIYCEWFWILRYT